MPNHNTTTFDPSLQGLAWLFSLTNYEKGMPAKYSGTAFSTGRFEGLIERLGSPHLCGIPTVQILGTDGKGSTLAFLEVLLESVGKKVCSFISPHLVSVEERFRIDSCSVPVEILNCHLETVRHAVKELEGITFFEVLNAAFWLWVNQVQPDVVLLETGLGGRLDTTTVCVPSVKILTLLDRDHVPLLGKRVEQIALEKLAALRPGVPTLINHQSPHLEAFIKDYLQANGIPARWVEWVYQAEVVARTRTHWEVAVHGLSMGGIDEFGTSPMDSRLRGNDEPTNVRVKSSYPLPRSSFPRRRESTASSQSQPNLRHYRLGLLGDHQAPNFLSALCAAESLGVDLAGLPTDLDVRPNWPGRCQLIADPAGGDWILDGSHTPMSAQALRSVLNAILPRTIRRTYLVAVSQDRFPWCYLRGLDLHMEDQVYLVDTGHPRLWKADELRTALMNAGWDDYPVPPLYTRNAKEMLSVSPVQGEVRIVCGSLYWVGEVMRVLEIL